MELERVIEILEKHQEWRRDQNVPPLTEMQSPIEIGTAIDYALSELKKLRLDCVSGISTDFEKDLFILVNKYAKSGLSKPHTVSRLEWVLGSVKKS